MILIALAVLVIGVLVLGFLLVKGGMPEDLMPTLIFGVVLIAWTVAFITAQSPEMREIYQNPVTKNPPKPNPAKPLIPNETGPVENR